MWSSTARSSRSDAAAAGVILSRRGDPQRTAAGPPAAWHRFEYAGAGRSAAAAASILRQSPGGDLISIAADKLRSASTAIRPLAGRIMDIAGIDVREAQAPADAPRPEQGGGGRRWRVLHLPVGMKGGEMQRHVGSEMLQYPGAQSFD